MKNKITRREVEEGSSPAPTSTCTFSALDVVAIKIRGEGGGHGRCPNDGGLVGRFLQWSIEEDVYPLSMGGHSGGGSYLHFYGSEDAEKVKKWLLANGVVNDDDKTWETR
jgi:hypothetical protein